MGEIQVGDRVTWRRERDRIWEVLRLKDNQALIAPLGVFRSVWVPLGDITRVDTPVVPASSLEALCDDYAEVMLREAGNIHSGVWEP